LPAFSEITVWHWLGLVYLKAGGSVLSCRMPVVSSQLSVVSCQFSVASFQLPDAVVGGRFA
jgi:hypothetical protein